jgi:hypothetical protein
MIKNEWPGEGYSHEGEIFCCQDCAEGNGCTCVSVAKPGFSREGQKVTPGQTASRRTTSGSARAQGELSGERDVSGTEEAIDQSGCSTTFAKSK